MRAKQEADINACKVLISDLERGVTAANTAAAAITAHLAKLEAKLIEAAKEASVTGDFTKTGGLSRLMQKLRTRREQILDAVSETDPKFAIDAARHAMVRAASRACMLSAMLL